MEEGAPRASPSSSRLLASRMGDFYLTEALGLSEHFICGCYFSYNLIK